MDAFQNLFLRRLLERINADMVERSAGLIAGHASDYADYKAKTSYLQALNDVVEICHDVERAMNRPEDEEAPGTRRRTLSHPKTLYGA